MKRLIIPLIALAALACEAKPVTILNAQQRAVIQRRRAVSREIIEQDGKQFIVVAYQRGSKPAGVETNEVVSIIGKAQNNPLENALRDLRAKLHTAIEERISAENHAAELEAAQASFLAWATKKRDEAVLATTKAIWQTVIDRISEHHQSTLDGEAQPSPITQ